MALDSLRFAHRFDQISGSAIREIFKMIAKPGMISFAGGNPAASALPDAECAEIARDVLQNDGKRILQYGATEGYPPLLESLHAYVEQQLGCAVPAVLPVTGSTQAMDLLCKALIDPGDVILVENPSFLGNMQCMRLYQATLVPVESDENGIIPEKLEEAMRQYHPKLLYTIPTFQNPTGITLSADRRKPIAELAAKYHVVVAEDDPYRDLRYAGEACPSILRQGWLGRFPRLIQQDYQPRSARRIHGGRRGHPAQMHRRQAVHRRPHGKPYTGDCGSVPAARSAARPHQAHLPQLQGAAGCYAE